MTSTTTANLLYRPMDRMEKRRWCEAIARVPGMTGALCHVCLVLIMHFHNDKNGKCFPKQQTIADFCNCSVDTVQRAIDKARRAGFLDTETIHRNDGSVARLVYRPIFPAATAHPTPQASGLGHSNPHTEASGPRPQTGGDPKPQTSGEPKPLPCGSIKREGEKKAGREEYSFIPGRSGAPPAAPAETPLLTQEGPAKEGIVIKPIPSSFDSGIDPRPAVYEQPASDDCSIYGQPPPAMRGMPVRLAPEPIAQSNGIELISLLRTGLELPQVDRTAELAELERQLLAMCEAPKS